jgi:hypothetical protein
LYLYVLQGPLHTRESRLRARDQYSSNTLIGGKGGAGPSSHHTTLEGTMEYICECKIGVKSTWIQSYMTSNGSCFMVTWTISKNHLLEVGQTQNRESMALGMFTIVDLFYFIMHA